MPAFDLDSLHTLTRDLLVAHGMRETHALATADSLRWADQRGIASHGIAFLPRYLQMLDENELALDTEPVQCGALPGPLVVDGAQCAGAVVMRLAMDVAERQAAAQSTALVWVRRLTHAGAMGQYVQAAARQGCMALLFVAGPPLMAYHGAAIASATTGPLAMAVPGPEGEPIVFDMSVSEISFAVMRRARQAGQPLPPGAAIDAQGHATTDPAQAVTPLPLAGAKGAGLALMFELMTSVVLGNPLVVPHLTGQAGHSQNALLMLARIDAFAGGADYASQVAALGETLRGLPLVQGAEVIRLPGERGARQALQDAPVMVNDVVWKALVDRAATCGLVLPTPLQRAA